MSDKDNKNKSQSWYSKLFGSKHVSTTNSQDAEDKKFLAQVQKAISAAGSYIRLAPLGKPVYTDWTAADAIREGFKASNWVYAAIKRLADAASSVEWKIQERSGSGEWKNVPGHPLELLIENPNPFMSRQDLIERITQHLNLAGNSILHKVKVKKTTVELWPINPDTIKPIPKEKGFIAGYQFYKGTNKDVIVKPEDIIHLMFSDPATPYWGMSPLQAVGKIVDTELEAIGWWKVSLQNRCVKDGILSFKRPLTLDQWTEAKEAVDSQLSGRSNARGPIVVGEDVDYQPFALTPAELDFINSRKMTRADILAVFCVPPPLVGVLDRATYANVQEARKIFWIETIMPFMESLRATLNRSLVPEFGDPKNLRIVIDYSNIDIFVDILADRALAADKLFRMGVPFNQISKIFGFGVTSVPTGDISFVPSNITPYGSTKKEVRDKISGSANVPSSPEPPSINNENVQQDPKKENGGSTKPPEKL